ncbi:peptidoglycan bridge formation glycyltransferase FemA/FemB family protein [Streptomyces sp. HPF1205]|uniref:lipid II:glycine glycyltransferase FemX n=1 Tax=Streptomyces sp. HPF1205 TaxID=2873262 RepID=UPI001CED7E52|nr:peptidoglycan bridge formation glycyltransferase FemA/FemB family protein [Streptomyces sp. HPF1205]
MTYENVTVGPISAADHLAFVRAQRSVGFLQTPAWGRVKTEWRGESLGWFEGRRLVGAALVLHRPVPRLGRFTLAYLPEGPVIDWTGEIGALLDPLAAYLKARGAFAIRLCPPVRTDTWSAAQVKQGLADPGVRRLTDLPERRTDPAGARVTALLKDAGWLPRSPEDGFGPGQPHFKYEVPLAGRTEDDLLAGMNQQWRRNIKKAAGEGVEVTVGDDIEAFHDLYVHTAGRDRFTPRPLRYFTTMFEAMRAEDPERIRLYLARHRGDLVAAAVLVRVGAHAWYVYGASSTDKREVRGSNACQWAMIRDSLAAGCDVYDLRGITPTLDAGDPHVGLIRFKVGTGGQAVRYVGEWDLPLRPVVYRAFDMYMRRRRGR